MRGTFLEAPMNPATWVACPYRKIEHAAFSKIRNETFSSLSIKLSVTGIIFLLMGCDLVLAVSAYK